MSRNVRLLSIFESTYAHGTFKEASKELGVSTSTISRALTDLEATIGSPLFYLVGNQFKPTQDGHNLYQTIKGLNRNYETRLNMFKKRGTHVVILSPPQVSNSFIIKLIKQYRESFYQNVTVEALTNYPSREQALDAVARGRVDLFIDTKPPKGSTFIFNKVQSYKLYALGHSKFFKRINDCVISDEQTKFVKVKWLEEYGEQVHNNLGITSTERVGYLTTDIHYYLEAINKHPYIGLVPDVLINSLAREYVFSDTPVGSVELYLITAKATRSKNKVTSWLYDRIKEIEDILLVQ